MKKTQIIFILLFVAGNLLAQSPFIRNYPPEEYKAHTQNWAILQDQRGVMYFGNINGILEYDGVNWRIIETESAVRSLAIDSTGRIYAGLQGDFGYLKVDSTGSLYYVSLKEKIPPKHTEFNEVWCTDIVEGKIYFNVNNKIFVLQNDSIQVLIPDETFYDSFAVHNRFYVQITKGLLYFDADSLHFLSGSEKLANIYISMILPYGQNKMLICTKYRGLFIYDNISENLYTPEGFDKINHFLIENIPYHGTVLSSGDFAIGTSVGGVIIFDEQGNIQKQYNNKNGLQDNVVWDLFEDKNKQLWSALDNGISLIQNNLPFTYYTAQNGLEGIIMSVNNFQDKLYVGTNQYLYQQNEKKEFEPIENTKGQNFCLYQTEGKLLLANTPNGTFEIDNSKAVLVHTVGTISFSSLHNQPNYLLTGGMGGLQLIEYKNRQWHFKHKIKGFDKPVYGLEEDKEGNLWANTYPKLYKLQLNKSMDSVIIEHCSAEKYNFSDDYAYPYRLNSSEIIFTTSAGIYRYLPNKNTFEVHPDFIVLKDVYPLSQDATGNLWFQETTKTGSNEKGILWLNNEKYEKYKTPFYKFTDFNSWAIYPYSDSTVYFGTTKGLLEYHSNQEINYDVSFNTLVRKVLVNDSLVYNGAGTLPKFQTLAKLKYEENNLFFHYATSFYEDAEKNLYSYRLIGSDTTWSAWTSDHKKEYTNLHEGDYRFEVKSKNVYRKIGSTSVYSFTIESPWYRTWLAYGIYGILIIFSVWFIVKLNSKRLIKEKQKLEQIVKERTAEMIQQKEEIETQRDNIEEKNEELHQVNEELNTTIETVNIQKTKIELAHKDITDSINYASRIQKAVLPSHTTIEKNLSEHFILFKPRDVVSGDFYWFRHIENYVVIAVADCTGHGVPGAFMSMLGISFLNEIIRRREVLHSDQVLNMLREEVKNAMGQTGKLGEQQDGMDIAISIINTQTRELQFSGAHNSLFMINSEAINNKKMDELKNNKKLRLLKSVSSSSSINSLLEIKADHQPIGIFIKEIPFTNHRVQLVEGDRLYMFSDGFPDQFGGKNGRKFMNKTFKQLLIDNSEKSMTEQQQILDTTITEWIGTKYDQIDDILVLGMKI